MITQLEQLSPGAAAYTFRFDESLLDELRRTYLEKVSPLLPEAWLSGGKSIHAKVIDDDCRFAVVSFGTAPLLWVSCDDEAAYSVFRRFFDALNIAEAVKPLVDYDRDIVLYCGFFVVSRHAEEDTWHEDYQAGANAFTLLTPLFDPDPSHGDLLYQDESARPCTYRYELGEAILVGESFEHSTEPYPANDDLRVLVSMTLGTDKMRYWPLLEGYLRHQSDFLILPCGHRLGTCDEVPR